MTRKQLKQLIRETIEEVSMMAEIDGMSAKEKRAELRAMVNILKNSDVVTETLSEGSFLKKISLLAIAMSLMISGISARELKGRESEMMDMITSSQQGGGLLSKSEIAKLDKKIREIIKYRDEMQKKIDELLAAGKEDAATDLRNQANDTIQRMWGEYPEGHPARSMTDVFGVTDSRPA
jgi:hypothetical protein